MPVRIQRKRMRGWRLPAGAVCVTRPGRWGNHYRAWRETTGEWWVSDGGNHHGPFADKRAAQAEAVRLYEADLTTPGRHHSRLTSPVPTPTDVWKELRGRDLACYCGPDEPCHGDILLAVANGPPPPF